MESERYHILVDPEADKRMAAHMEFLARVSEPAALRLYDAYKEALEFLETFPESCPRYYPATPISEELRYKLFSGRYRIVFEVIVREVYVYDIQDCRQDSDKNLILRMMEKNDTSEQDDEMTPEQVKAALEEIRVRKEKYDI